MILVLTESSLPWGLRERDCTIIPRAGHGETEGTTSPRFTRER